MNNNEIITTAANYILTLREGTEISVTDAVCTINTEEYCVVEKRKIHEDH